MSHQHADCFQPASSRDPTSTDSSELIKRLRTLASTGPYPQGAYHVAMDEAADELERLNTLVRDLTELIHSFQDARTKTAGKIV